MLIRGAKVAIAANLHPMRAAIVATAVTDWRSGVPNALTTGRVLALPALVSAFYQCPGNMTAIIFTACAFTDWLDGYLARRWRVHSAFGAFLDPVADKLLVCTCLVLLSGALGAVVALPTAVIVGREVSVSALRAWMGAQGASSSVAVSWWGKVKTATQMSALLLLLLAEAATSASRSLLLTRCGLSLLYVATALTVTSATGYVRDAWPLLVAAPKAS